VAHPAVRWTVIHRPSERAAKLEIIFGMESSEDWFDDEANPKEAEIVRWAYADASPFEDWDLIISDADYAPLLIRLIGDPACRGARYFLRALYVLTGDAVRTCYRHTTEHEVGKVIALAHESADESLRLWAYRSDELMRNPTQFEYYAWCDGGLARTPRLPTEVVP
jgi:hypothetical protein